MRLLLMICVLSLAGDVQAQDLDELPDSLGDELEDEETGSGEAVIFVSPFVAKNREATGMAGMMPGFLEMELDQHPDLRVVGIEDAFKLVRLQHARVTVREPLQRRVRQPRTPLQLLDGALLPVGGARLRGGA